MAEYGYSRTSTDEQDGQGQRHRLIQAGIDPSRIFTDIGISGMKASRPEFNAVLALLGRGDILTVPELSRLGRSVINVLSVIDDLESRGVGLRILDLALDTTTPVGRMVVTVLASIARLERDLISSRTRAALDARKAAGVRLGAAPKVTPRDAASIRAMRESGISAAVIGQTLGLARSTVYRVLANAEAS